MKMAFASHALVAATLFGLGAPAFPANPVLDQWAASVDLKEMADAIARVDSLQEPDESKTEYHIALLSIWARRDLTAALNWFTERGGADSLHQQARDVLARTMAQRDPPAMVSWMEKHLPVSARDELYLPLFQQLTLRDPAAAAELVHSFSDTADASSRWADLAGQVAAQWANTDVRGAAAWAQRLPQGSVRSQALAALSHRWTESDPAAALDYSSRHDEPRLQANVAAKWAESDPSAASAWVLGLPEGSEGRVAAVANIMNIWSQKDPSAAAHFTAGLSLGALQDQAALAVVAAWSEKDPAQTAKWLERMVESPLREEAMQTLLRSWTGRNPAEAEAWLRNLSPTASVRAGTRTLYQIRDATNLESRGE